MTDLTVKNELYEPSLLLISNPEERLVSIAVDGTVTYYKEGAAPEAARIFYESLQIEGRTLHRQIAELKRELAALREQPSAERVREAYEQLKYYLGDFSEHDQADYRVYRAFELLSKIAAPQNETSQGSRLTIRSAGVVADSSAGAAPHIASDDARGISQRDVPCRIHLMINCERCFPDAPQPSPD